MSQLASEQHNLPAVMAFMRDEVCKNVADVQGKVAPNVRRGDRNTATGVATEPEKAVDPQTATFERRHQFLSADSPAIDLLWHRNAMLLTDHLDPHAPSVVDMSGNHTDRATRSTWNARSPERGGQVLDEKDRHAVIGPPRCQDRVSEIRRGQHYQPLHESCASRLTDPRSAADRANELPRIRVTVARGLPATTTCQACAERRWMLLNNPGQPTGPSVRGV
jgi:hypothetical protein